ncbi:MAG: ribonuclease Z, partial [Anaerolineae bacterium]
LGGLASTFARWESAESLTIYAGAYALERVRDLMAVVLRGGDIKLKVHFEALAPGPLLTAGDLDVVAFPVKHRGGGSFGFLFQERSRRPFLVPEAEALGVPPGPERRELVQGRSITLADGRVIAPDDVLGPREQGTKLVVVGDTARVTDLVTVARRADLLVCESTYLAEDVESARRFSHITAREAAELAKAADVGGLVLTHVSRRYATRNIVKEARSVFPNSFVAEDFDHYEVMRGEVRRGALDTARRPRGE